MAKLNDKQVKSLLRQGKTGRVSAGNGLYLRVSEEGTGFWAVRYTIGGKRREIVIGRYPELSLAKATAGAIQLRENVRQGIDPIAEKKRPDAAKIATVDDLAADWLKNDIEKRLKHPEIPRRVYTKDLSPYFGELSLKRISPIDIRQAIEKITESGRPSIANDALHYCKQLFRHGIRLDLLKFNPAEAFTIHQAGGVEKSRSRALTMDELKTTFQVFRENSAQFTRENYLATALLLVLGVRKGELIAATWDEFDFDELVWHLPKHRSKTGQEITFPLPTVTIEWFKELHIRACGSEYLFPSRRASKRRGYISDDTLNHALAKLFGQKVQPGDPPDNKLGEAGVAHFTIHDLRRTCRSLLSSVGVPGHVAERCLNHKLKGVEGIYDRYDYLEERREALQKVGDMVQPLIDLTPNVVSFRQTGNSN